MSEIKMACLPDSGGCERRFTEPFIDHLNALQGSSYTHKACLDQLYRNRRQPEALYEDATTGRQLVVERKSVVWPPGYAGRHRRDHRITELLFHALPEEICTGRYILELEHLFEGTRNEAEKYASGIAEAVKDSLARVTAGQPLGSRKPGRRWVLREQHPSEYGDWETDGLVILFESSDLFLTLTRLNEYPPDLVNEIGRVLRDAAAKFFEYLKHHRLVLLSGQGDLGHMPG